MTEHDHETGPELVGNDLDEAVRWWNGLPLAAQQSLKTDPTAAVDVTLLNDIASHDLDSVGASWTAGRAGANGFYLSPTLARFVAQQDAV